MMWDLDDAQYGTIERAYEKTDFLLGMPGVPVEVSPLPAGRDAQVWVRHGAVTVSDHGYGGDYRSTPVDRNPVELEARVVASGTLRISRTKEWRGLEAVVTAFDAGNTDDLF